MVWPVDFVAADAEIACGEAVAAFVAMAAAVFPPAFILRNLRRLKPRPPLLRRQLRVLSDLFGPLRRRQFGPVKVLADGPHPRLDIIKVDEANADALDVKQLQRLYAVSAGDEDEAAVAFDDRRRALQADRLNRAGPGPETTVAL